MCFRGVTGRCSPRWKISIETSVNGAPARQFPGTVGAEKPACDLQHRQELSEALPPTPKVPPPRDYGRRWCCPDRFRSDEHERRSHPPLIALSVLVGITTFARVSRHQDLLGAAGRSEALMHFLAGPRGQSSAWRALDFREERALA
jgi:hypothetical protein